MSHGNFVLELERRYPDSVLVPMFQLLFDRMKPSEIVQALSRFNACDDPALAATNFLLKDGAHGCLLRCQCLLAVQKTFLHLFLHRERRGNRARADAGHVRVV